MYSFCIYSIHILKHMWPNIIFHKVNKKYILSVTVKRKEINEVVLFICHCYMSSELPSRLYIRGDPAETRSLVTLAC